MDKTGKHIFPDADFGQIVWTIRKGMRSITMRLKRGGLYVCTSPYQQKSNMLKVVETYRKRLLSLRAEVSYSHFDWTYSIQTECFHLCVKPSGLKNYTLRQDNDNAVVFCPKSTDFSDKRVQEIIYHSILKALFQRAEEYLLLRLSYWSHYWNLPVNGVRITKARSYWGNCTSKKQINLSCFLMLLPAYLIDYVILHELAHTKEMNHSPRFWELLNSMTVNHALDLRKELRNYHPIF